MFATLWESAGQGYMTFLVFMAIGLLGVGRMLRKHDPEGKIKGAAKTGIVSLISRWMK